MAKGNVNTSPAMAAYENSMKDSAERSVNFWMPVQQYFARSLNQNQPGLEEGARGVAGASARSAGFGAVQQVAGADAQAGRSAGSGAFLSDMQRGRNATTQSAATGMADATNRMERQWVGGMQDVIGMGQADQATAQAGMKAAADQEQAYEEARAQYFNNAMAGIRQAASQLVSSAAGSGMFGGTGVG